MALLVLIVILCLLLAGAVYQAIGRANDRRHYPPRGRLVDIGGRRMHIVESGSGGTPVILEAGIAASSVSWSLVQPEVAKFTRVCSYDRAGLGLSDAAREPRTLDQSLRDLHALLVAASVPAPFILVGHSYGGLLVRAYAARYPSEIAGLVLVDPVPVQEWRDATDSQKKILRRAVRLSRRGALLARFGVVRFALGMLLSGGSRLAKLVAKAASGRAESVASRLVTEVGKLPRECWPVVRAQWCDPKSFVGMADHLEQLPVNAAALQEMGQLPCVPLAILSAANSTASQMQERDQLARDVPRGVHLMATNSGHWIPFDEPQLIVRVLREILQRVTERR